MMTGETKKPLSLKKTAGTKPPLPTIVSPAEGSQHTLGRVFVEGCCLWGAAVEVLNHDDSKLDDAKVKGDIWSYSRNWGAGTKHVKARQIVNGVASDPTKELKFYVSPPRTAPTITSPKDGSRYPVGNVRIEGNCAAGTTAVNVLSHDSSPLGEATVNGTQWFYDRVWNAGDKHVKATQVVNGATSDASGMIEFIVG